MRAGDVVLWSPDLGEPERWLLAYERNGRCSPVADPDCEVPVDQVDVLDAASDEEHEATLRGVAATGGRRGAICEDQLLDLLESRDEFVRVRPITTVRFERETPPRAVPRGHCGRCDRCGWPLGPGSWCTPENCTRRPRLDLRNTCAGCGAPYEKGPAT